jgi:hypothetical protein
MASFNFRVDSFTIRNTRAVHEDTVFVNVTVEVNGTPAGSKTVAMGDRNNGTFNVPGAVVGPVNINPQDQVVCTYLLTNSGHKDRATVNQTLTDAGHKIAAGLAATGNILAAAGAEIVNFLAGIFTVDCDGPVAAGRFQFSGAELSGRAAPRLEQTVASPGTDTSVGCGSNSDYSVTWSVTQLGAVVQPVQAVSFRIHTLDDDKDDSLTVNIQILQGQEVLAQESFGGGQTFDDHTDLPIRRLPLSRRLPFDQVGSLTFHLFLTGDRDDGWNMSADLFVELEGGQTISAGGTGTHELQDGNPGGFSTPFKG